MKQLLSIPVLVLGVLIGVMMCATIVTTSDVIEVGEAEEAEEEGEEDEGNTGKTGKKDGSDVSDWGKKLQEENEETTEIETNLMGTIEESKDSNDCGVYTTINLIIMFLTFGVAIAATVGLVITAIIYITSGDNANRLAMAKTRALEIVVGLGIYAVMWSLSQWLIPGGIMNDGEICKQVASNSVSEDDEEDEAKDGKEEIAEEEEVEISGVTETSNGGKGSGAKGASNDSGKVSLKGKKVLVEGDSIQTKEFGQFLTEMAKSLKAKSITNKAVSGSTLAYNRNGKVGEKSVYYRIIHTKDEELAKYDYIIISAGTNDWYKYSGVDSGFGHGERSKDVATTYGAIVGIETKLEDVNKRYRERSNPIRTIYFSPIYRYNNSGSRSPSKEDKADCDKIENEYGQTLSDYRFAIQFAVSNYALHGYYISGTTLSTKKEASSKKNLKDWLHPTKSYAKTLAKRAKNNLGRLSYENDIIN